MDMQIHEPRQEIPVSEILHVRVVWVSEVTHAPNTDEAIALDGYDGVFDRWSAGSINQGGACKDEQIVPFDDLGAISASRNSVVKARYSAIRSVVK